MRLNSGGLFTDAHLLPDLSTGNLEVNSGVYGSVGQTASIGGGYIVQQSYLV